MSAGRVDGLGDGPADGPVVCVGETMAALAPEPVASLDSADLLRLDVAGAESNVAMYLADHGVPARWVSALGDDPFGRRVRDRVAAFGVDVSGVRTDPARPTGLLIKDPGTEATRVHYYRRGSAASALGPDLLDDEAFRGAGLVHLTGITPALSASCRALVEGALAAERPYAVSFDVNYRPGLWAEDSAGDVLLPLADRADTVFVGLDEAQALWGDDLTDAAAVRKLLPGPETLVVKDGSREATAFVGPSSYTVPALRVEVIEPVGAGDAFAAGFLAGRRRYDDPVRALRLGHLTAMSALRVPTDHGPLPAAATMAELLGANEEEWAGAVVGTGALLGAETGTDVCRSRPA
ncbi:sugar kinase [Streptomyces sp. 150FB]|uniref:sugar kinase n=1 Tax=Streptomyces sp. 150FB TaxID=1576605 RepID=UPI000B0A2FCC|nr:sugar kinase [Streptomyces sp. 150FB]